MSVRRTFQALRVAVNEEFSSLEALLRALPQCLAPGGRVAIITFHSGRGPAREESVPGRRIAPASTPTVAEGGRSLGERGDVRESTCRGGEAPLGGQGSDIRPPVITLDPVRQAANSVSSSTFRPVSYVPSGTDSSGRHPPRAGVELMDPAQVMQRALGRSEPGVAPIGVVAIGQVQDVGGADRRVLDLARAAAAQPLIALDRLGQRGRARFAKAGGEDDCVLDRLVGALPMVRRQLRVRRPPAVSRAPWSIGRAVDDGTGPSGHSQGVR